MSEAPKSPQESREGEKKFVIVDGGTLTPEEIQHIASTTERVFDANNDERQGNPTAADLTKLIAADSHTVVAAKEGEKIIGWSFGVPTTRENMEDFLNGRINEKTMFARAIEDIKFEVLYLMASYVEEDSRKQSVGSSLGEARASHFKNVRGIQDFFAWTFTDSGKRLAEKISAKIGANIRILSDIKEDKPE